MAANSKLFELLQAHGDVVNFLLRVYATDEVIAKAYRDVSSIRQIFAMTKEIYLRLL